MFIRFRLIAFYHSLCKDHIINAFALYVKLRSKTLEIHYFASIDSKTRINVNNCAISLHLISHTRPAQYSLNHKMTCLCCVTLNMNNNIVIRMLYKDINCSIQTLAKL